MPHESHTVGSTLVVTWQKPELRDVATVVATAQQMSKRLGKQITYVAYIPDSTATPEKPVRDAMTRSFADLKECCDNVYLILEGTGFRLSIGRAALAGILLVSGKRGQIHVCASLEEAAAMAPAAAIDYLRVQRAKNTGS